MKQQLASWHWLMLLWVVQAATALCLTDSGDLEVSVGPLGQVYVVGPLGQVEFAVGGL